MRSKLGTGSMIVGAVLVVAALALFLANQWEAAQAAASVDAVLPQIVAEIEQEEPDDGQDPAAPNEMAAVEIDGHSYIGYLSIPGLGLELPVIADWDYDSLKVAPCRYSGAPKTNDLVIAGHNYIRHFGPIDRLQPGDTVDFTDMDGETYHYEVKVVDILSATAVEEMTSGAYDLTLFTCNYDGQARITVRCDRS